MHSFELNDIFSLYALQWHCVLTFALAMTQFLFIASHNLFYSTEIISLTFFSQCLISISANGANVISSIIYCQSKRKNYDGSLSCWVAHQRLFCCCLFDIYKFNRNESVMCLNATCIVAVMHSNGWARECTELWISNKMAKSSYANPQLALSLT